MEWLEVIEHPSLKDLPFKIETNRWGEIVMTPATVRHGEYQGLIIEWLVNTLEEMERKKRLYFEKGAQEVWFCDKLGDMHFFSASGKLARSRLFAQFPEHIDRDVAP